MHKATQSIWVDVGSGNVSANTGKGCAKVVRGRFEQICLQACASNPFIREAASKGTQVMVLPECFNSPYGTSHFPEYCEPIPGESTECLRQVAKETKTYMYVIGGKYIV